MNRGNVLKAIAIMERARGHVRMLEFQTVNIKNILKIDLTKLAQPLEESMLVSGRQARTEADAHLCGNKACFAGWVALAPEFHADGGASEYGGVPVIDGYIAECAIARWLDIPVDLACGFVYGDCEVDANDLSAKLSNFYGKDFREVEADDVIEKLKGLLNEPL